MEGSVLFVFVDGVGLGPGDPALNPLVRARAPVLRELAGGSLTLEASGGSSDPPTVGPLRAGPSRGLAGLDATLGVDGTPASGTGHVAVLTGANGPALHGQHFGPWVPVALRPFLAHQSLLFRSTARGTPTRFANAYPEPLARSAPPRFQPGFTLAAREAGLLTRHGEALAHGEAVAGSIDTDLWRRRAPEGTAAAARIPRVTPEDAGRTLAGLASAGGLTVFAHYDTDRAGHRGGMEGAVGAVERLDRFVAGILDALPSDALLCVASDHGNLEDVRQGHTRNPALALLHGPGAQELLEGLRAVTDLAPALLSRLGGEDDGGRGQDRVSRRGQGVDPDRTPPGSGAPRGPPGSATNDGRTLG